MKMLIVVGLGLSLALAGAGCRKEEPARQARGVAVAPVAVVADAGGAPADVAGGDADAADTAGDAGAADDAGTVGVAWPAAIEVKMVSTQKALTRTFSVDTELPRFRTRPVALATELNARFAQYVKSAPGLRGYHGSYYAHCRAELVSRFAVIVECGEMTDARTKEEAEAAMGGAPAGPQPQRLAVWLQPGLPAIELGQLAPGIDGAAVIARAVKGAPATCDPRWCEYQPASFALDAEGVLFRPTAYCALECDAEHQPRIPLDALRPAHPWAVQLVGWIRQRTEAGEGLVEGQADP